MAAILILVSGLVASDQFKQQTLFNKASVLGGYIGPTSFIGTINDKYAVYTGGSIALLMNHRVIIGLTGYGLVNGVDISIEGTQDDSTRYLEMGYGGLEFGYVVAPSQLIHIRVSSLFGIGGMGSHTRYRWHANWNEDWDNDWEDDWDMYKDVFFVVQPAIMFELNVAKFCRIDVGATYRYMSGFEFERLKTGDLDGVAIMTSINFGFY